MFGVIDEILKEYLEEYFKPLKGIKYVKGENIDPTPVKELSKITTINGLRQLQALASLYYTSESMIIQGKSPYLIIDVDDDGHKYAEITPNYIKLAKKGGFVNKKTCWNPSSRFKKVNIGNMDEISDEVVGDNLLEDTIDYRLDHEICKRVERFAGVKEIPSENDVPGMAYTMIFVPSNDELQGKNIVIDGKGVLYDNYNAEPLVKTKGEHKLCSN